jgi:two-component system, NtrC family, sensor kinase
MIPILIVDDDERNRRFLARLLETGEYSCTLAASAQEARRFLGTQLFSLVLCDVSMPHESGLDLALDILAKHPETAVVMVSGLDDPKIAQAALAMGAYGYILKPFKAIEMLIHVSNALRRRKLEIQTRTQLGQLEQVVAERTAELQKSIAGFEDAERLLHRAHEENEQLLSAISSILIAVDGHGAITKWNHAAEKTFGIAAQSAVGKPFDNCGIQWDSNDLVGRIQGIFEQDQPVRIDDIRFTRFDGKDRVLGLSVSPLKQNDHDGARSGFLLFGADITERKVMEAQLRQAQKLESVGQLAAGIAHEINTPTQFVGNNIRFLEDSFRELALVLTQHSHLVATNGVGVSPEFIKQMEATAKQVDLEYLMKEIPKAISQSLEGIERVAKIVRSMKEFAHPGTTEKVAVDLKEAIESTIEVTKHEWKYVAEMMTDFDPALPKVPCLVGELNQVIVNLIVNAVHSISDALKQQPDAKGKITITTRKDSESAEICIGDTGTGIPQAIRSKIFDPFFTTKAVGKGTGQGLAIAHAVVEKHGGSIAMETEVGRGTTFILRLPIDSQKDEQCRKDA